MSENSTDLETKKIEEAILVGLEDEIPNKIGELIGKSVGKTKILAPVLDALLKNFAPRISTSVFYTRLFRPSALAFTAVTMYDFFEQAANAADRLKEINPELYKHAYDHNIEMFYFLLEPHIGIYLKLASKFDTLTEKEKVILDNEIKYLISGIRTRTDLVDNYGDY